MKLEDTHAQPSSPTPEIFASHTLPHMWKSAGGEVYSDQVPRLQEERCTGNICITARCSTTCRPLVLVFTRHEDHKKVHRPTGRSPVGTTAVDVPCLRKPEGRATGFILRKSKTLVWILNLN